MATDKPIPRRASARPATDDRPAQLILIYPNHISDPYPERLAHDTGVRQYTELGPLPSWTDSNATPATHPPTFAASFTTETRSTKGHRIPWASLGLYALGQMILAAAIAFGSVNSVTGITVCLLWLLCGLLLVVAQVISDWAAGR